MPQVAGEANAGSLEEATIVVVEDQSEKWIEVEDSVDDNLTDVEDETDVTEITEKTGEFSEEESTADLIVQLEHMIKEFQNRRDLWEEYNALPL